MFDVRLNNEHMVVKNLDIFSKVGKAMAHDEYIPFTISDDMLEVLGEKSPFHGSLSIEFLKVRVCVCVRACVRVCGHTVTVSLSSLQGAADNPKVNAIVVIRGSVDGKHCGNIHSMSVHFSELLEFAKLTAHKISLTILCLEIH